MPRGLGVRWGLPFHLERRDRDNFTYNSVMDSKNAITTIENKTEDSYLYL